MAKPISALSPALAPVWLALHERLSTGRPVSGVKVGPLENEQRVALADLLGRRHLPGRYWTVPVPPLESVLRDSLGVGVREVVTELVGPIGDRAGDRARARTERAELWSWLDTHPIVLAQPALREWTGYVHQVGLIEKSVTRTRDELDKALRVLELLPADGISLPVLAEQALGDPHALDDKHRRTTLVLRALAAIYQVPTPGNAGEMRALWDRAGVTADELSSVVLAAGFRPSGTEIASVLLGACADAAQATALTLSHLRAGGVIADVPRAVWVFENPSVLATALARFGSGCPPLVCTAGWPNSAAVLLLRLLSSAGATLYYHGDFDGEGLRIAAYVIARTGAVPWRMDSEDYLAAVADGPPVGRVTPVPWDDELNTHLETHGTTVSEERLAEALLDDIVRCHRT